MATLRESVSRLWGTLRGTRADRDLEEELRLHLELASEDARRRSGPPEPQLRAAAIQAGGVAQAMEALRDQRGLPWLQDLVCDLRYGCRMLAKNPGFTLVAVLSLAIGIGANTAVFSFADTLLLRVASAGLGAGLLASAGVARGLGSIFPGGLRSDGTDFVAFPLVASGVLAVTLLAAYLPARRASRVNPTDVLRHE